MPIKVEALRNDLNRLLSSQDLEQLFSLPLRTPPFFQGSFTFPKTPDYCNWLCEMGEGIAKQKGIVGQDDQCLYNQIVDRERIPVATETLLKINGIYIIADSDGEILYIGKSGANFYEGGNDRVIYRILDHFVPKSINKMQNTPELWDRIREGKNVQVDYFSGLDRLVPSLLELYLLNQYYLDRKTLPSLNKRRHQKDRTA